MNGNVWTWGYNGHKELGRDTATDRDTVPAIIDPSFHGGEKVIDVQAKGDNTYILTDQGKLFAFGACGFG